MSLRTTHQPAVDEFLADLETYATGSYLRDDEKKLWEQPFDPAAIPELRRLIERFLDDAEGTDQDAAVALAAQFITDVNAFNRAHGYAVIEQEEEAELSALIMAVLSARNVGEETVRELPEFD